MKFLITITLSFVLVLALGTSCNAKYNNKPCMKTKNWNGYNNFLMRHILPPCFDPKIPGAWKAHITYIVRCKTENQSFIPYDSQEKVEGICNGQGKTLAGRKYPGNLCISDNNITVYHVKVDTTTCEVTNDVELDEEQLIVACDKVKNRCRPVHFEGKKDDQESDNNSKVCKP